MSEIIVHHLETSRSTRILWMLEELEVPYEIVTHPRVKGRATDSLKAVHPLGKSPAVILDGQVLVESGAIIETIAERLGEGRLGVSRDDAAFQDYRFYLHYAEGSVMTPLLVKLLMNKVRTAPLPFFIKPIAKGIVGKIDGNYTDGEITLHADFLEQALGTDDWFVNNTFSAADIQLCYPIFALVERGGVSKPGLAAWCARVSARPAWKRALDKGGPLLPEV